MCVYTAWTINWFVSCGSVFAIYIFQKTYLLFGFYYNSQGYYKDWKRQWVGKLWKLSRLYKINCYCFTHWLKKIRGPRTMFLRAENTLQIIYWF